MKRVEPELKCLNLGAGVQSTTLALMAARGALPDGELPHFAVFADTGWEPTAVYQHLQRLIPLLEPHFPVKIASAGNLRERLLALPDETVLNKVRFAAVPFFTTSGGMGRRQCTKEYKISPIRHVIKAELGLAPGKRARGRLVECWMGITTDEAVRMKDSDVEWVRNRWPLVELNMSRFDCIEWLQRNGYPVPPKSSCLGCPYHGDDFWNRLKRDSPAEFADTVKVDQAIRDTKVAGMNEQQYIHRSLLPLDQVRFDHDEGQLDLFGNECDGMCGV